MNEPEKVNDWLIEDIGATDRVWKFGSYHFPMYYAGPELSNDDGYPMMREGIELLDVLFAGHEHNFARTFPIKNEELFDKPSEGTIHYELGNSNSNPPGTMSCHKVWHAAHYPCEEQISTVAIVEVFKDKVILTSKVVEDGRIIDECIIDKKKEIYNTAIKLHPGDYRAYNNLGVLAYNAGDYSTADSYFKKALAVDGNALEAQLNLGYLALLEGDVAAAESHMTVGVDSKAAEEAFGNLFIAQGMYSRAVSLLEGKNTNSTALAQLLNKNYGEVRETLDNIENPDAMTHYIRALLGARTQNVAFVYDGLKEAVKLDPSMAKKAAGDLEFTKYLQDATFKSIIK